MRLESNGAGDHQGGGAGGNTPTAIWGLHKGGGGHGDAAGRGGKFAGSFVIGVVHPFGQGYAIQGDSQIGEDGVKGIGDCQIIGGNGSGIALVADDKGVGQAAVFGHGNGRNRLSDAKIGTRAGRNGFLRGNRGRKTASGNGNGIGNVSLSAQRGKAVGGGLIDRVALPPAGTVMPPNCRGGPAITVGAV